MDEPDVLDPAQRIYAETVNRIETEFWAEVQKLRKKRAAALNEAYQAAQAALRMTREGRADG